MLIVLEFLKTAKRSRLPRHAVRQTGQLARMLALRALKLQEKYENAVKTSTCA